MYVQIKIDTALKIICFSGFDRVAVYGDPTYPQLYCIIFTFKMSTLSVEKFTPKM